MMLKTATILSIALTAFSVEISASYALLEKQGQFKPDLKTEPVDKATFKRDVLELEPHPVYKPEGKRPNIEPVKPIGQVNHDRMLADQPSHRASEVNQHDSQPIPGYEYVPGNEEAVYPDVPYAPGYGYNGNNAGNRYDMYGNSPSTYYVEPDTSTFSLLWSQVPDARTIVSYIGKFVSWTLGSFFLLFLGSALTVGVCSYTNLCTITFNNVQTIREIRSLATADNLEKISNAATFVKTAIDKYNEVQNVPNVAVRRRRRAIVY